MTNDQMTEVHYCYRHPTVETNLRCKKCGKYICSKCARRTPTGYICPDCLREQENRFYTGGLGDYPLAVLVALPLSLIAGGLFTFLIGSIGWFSWLIAFFLSPIVAGFIAEAVRWAVRRRRSRYLAHVVVGSLVGGVAPFLVLMLLAGSFYGLIVPGIFLVMGTGTIMARLR